MRKTLFALAALSGVALAMPALAEGITPDTYRIHPVSTAGRISGL